jgi:hypothetical protein
MSDTPSGRPVPSYFLQGHSACSHTRWLGCSGQARSTNGHVNQNITQLRSGIVSRAPRRAAARTGNPGGLTADLLRTCRYTCCNMPQHAATCRNMPQHAATCRNILPHAATYCNMPQHAATCRNMPQHTATCRNMLRARSAGQSVIVVCWAIRAYKGRRWKKGLVLRRGWGGNARRTSGGGGRRRRMGIDGERHGQAIATEKPRAYSPAIYVRPPERGWRARVEGGVWSLVVSQNWRVRMQEGCPLVADRAGEVTFGANEVRRTGRVKCYGNAESLSACKQYLSRRIFAKFGKQEPRLQGSCDPENRKKLN